MLQGLTLSGTGSILTRRIKDILRIAKTNGHALILLGCRLNLPAEIDHEITRIEFGLPDASALAAVMDGIIVSASLPELDLAVRESALANSLGLTTTEAENVFALSVVEAKAIDPAIIAREKATALKRNGLVEIVQSTTRLEDVGGLENLKEWLTAAALVVSLFLARIFALKVQDRVIRLEMRLLRGEQVFRRPGRDIPPDLRVQQPRKRNPPEPAAGLVKEIPTRCRR